MWFHDVFICHASEDKDDFVRPLADRLRDAHVDVWFDEFSLRMGDGLRRSIDQGLARSRYGLVVLSPAFFAKHWPQRELDGLTARETSDGIRVVLPVWHCVTKGDVLRYSPPLADVLAADSARGLDDVVRRVLEVVRPRGSPLVLAREALIEMGIEPPVVTDEWWLDVVEASNREPCAGMVSQRRHWGRWSFPLPPDGDTPEERGERLAWTALQLPWEDAADAEAICQITPPKAVLEFIGRQPGLADACHDHPWYLANYAPQLTIEGFGGEFEEDFREILAASMAEAEKRRQRRDPSGAALSTDGLPPGCEIELALRHPHLGYFRPASLACQFVQGDIGGPPPKFYETADYLFWLLSSASGWLPVHIRAALTEGMEEWPVWPWPGHSNRYADRFGIDEHEHAGALFDELVEPGRAPDADLSSAARTDLVGRAMATAQLLRLPETGEELSNRFLARGFIAAYLAKQHRR